LEQDKNERLALESAKS